MKIFELDQQMGMTPPAVPGQPPVPGQPAPAPAGTSAAGPSAATTAAPVRTV